MTSATTGMQQAILAGGCFWCTEAVLKDVRGVHRIESGYIGGHTPNPDYRSVCSGATGHAEAVRVTFDPAQVSYKDLLGLFFATHDPTSLNRQGADVGTQYRSAVFPLTPEQDTQTREVIADLTAQDVFGKPIVTTIEPASEFFVAEDYHQNYYENNPRQPYCMAVIAPKVSKMRQYYSDRLRA
ncbi:MULTISPECIES: peptide-methionine (S)-S-oxide reductase MsrA [Deinococcus]|uniref:Peptide methionine sulfoxide reductase MsrA n=2 Tax=Deinococcus soli (ex Cha et al. 2016) TaxID=1309411 RepID=A0A0F7JP51_9DEIO|nr:MULTISPECIES: peptide-methionine (S)-S-oxide reductase MsrA [Deinococcus]AKH18211.1 methionine sulfoxide reductase A [Deinococcus soli (ex Cha et al. 2016)]MDK2011385.1 peptide-methionine (S)-S-oxide reductase MsrA [Deinococcus sp. 43]MDR6217567.1 peptide-methionine (S)-S-oxide reductase [Deinococcus soli (ex Cha et al. 2016)]MDR6326876.1 peptide-methionine (S)-S-oxide reductase [Deinococcus soli (ex Cha et al. 2016)]MDR6750398.1 peptide-methionine (S)-S-oxide reductase [Deinococcus soli (e